MASIFVKVDGLSELGDIMRGLAEDVNKRLCARATNKGAQLIKDLAIVRAPVWPKDHMLEGVLVPSGNLKKNIVVKKVAASQTPLTAEYIVTVRGKKKDAYAARYGRLVEFGTINQAPHSFLRAGFEAGKFAAVEVIKDELTKGIERAVDKAAK